MTITTDTFRFEYDGNGSSVDFAFPVLFLDQTHLVVTLIEDATGTEDVQNIGSEYTVSGVGRFTGGIVTFLTAPPSGYTVRILRLVPITQETDFRNQGRFLQETHEAAFDRLTMIAMQLQEEFDRAFALTLSSADGVNTTLPAAVAGNAIGWNADGDQIVNLTGNETDIAFINNVIAQVTADAQAILDNFLSITQNVTISTALPDNLDGNDGDIWLVVPA